MMRKDRTAEIEDLFPGGRWSGGEYIIRCPLCGDSFSHSHCSINVEKGVFKCFYCGASGKLRWLIKEYAGDQPLSFLSGIGITEKQRMPELPFFQFQEFFKPGFLPETLEQKAWSYLQARGITRADVEYYHLRWADRGRYFGRVILPVLEEGEVVCWSARAFLDVLKPKYLFPHYGETLLTCSEAIFGYDGALHSPVIHKCLVLVEGIFDAIAVNKAFAADATGMFSLSILSKMLSDGQLLKLQKFDKKTTQFYIMVDPDATKDGIKIAKRLSSYGRVVRVCHLKGAKDPGEATSSQILDAIAEAILYNDSLELRTTLGLKGE